MPTKREKLANLDTFGFLSSSLALSTDAIAYSVSERLDTLFPEQAILEGYLEYCDVEKYAAEGRCTLQRRPGIHNQLASRWDEELGLERIARNCWFEVGWNKQTLQALILTWTSGFQEKRYLWIIAEDQAIAGRHEADWRRGSSGPPGRRLDAQRRDHRIERC